jgi:hypothetical protein
VWTSRGPTGIRVISILCICAKIVRARPATTNASKKNRSPKLHRHLRLLRRCPCSSRSRAHSLRRLWANTRFKFRFPMATRREFIPTITCARSVHARSVRRSESSGPRSVCAVSESFEICLRPDLESRHACHTLDSAGSSRSRESLPSIGLVSAAQAFSSNSELCPIHLSNTKSIARLTRPGRLLLGSAAVCPKVLDAISVAGRTVLERLCRRAATQPDHASARATYGAWSRTKFRSTGTRQKHGLSSLNLPSRLSCKILWQILFPTRLWRGGT